MQYKSLGHACVHHPRVNGSAMRQCEPRVPNKNIVDSNGCNPSTTTLRKYAADYRGSWRGEQDDTLPAPLECLNCVDVPPPFGVV